MKKSIFKKKDILKNVGTFIDVWIFEMLRVWSALNATWKHIILVCQHGSNPIIKIQIVFCLIENRKKKVILFTT